MTNCACCGSKDICEKIITETFEYKGYKHKIENCKINHCNNCGEEFLHTESIRRYQNESETFIKEVEENVSKISE